jgi:hypothetical protein
MDIEFQDIDLEQWKVAMHDHPSFDKANELFALSQPPPGKGRIWTSIAMDGYTAATVMLPSGMVWYDDVRQHMGTWTKFLQIAKTTVTSVHTSTTVDAISFTCSAVSESLTEYRQTYSFTPHSARVGVLPINRWVWTWRDLDPTQTVKDIQTAIFDTQETSP